MRWPLSRTASTVASTMSVGMKDARRAGRRACVFWREPVVGRFTWRRPYQGTLNRRSHGHNRRWLSIKKFKKYIFYPTQHRPEANTQQLLIDNV